MKNETDSMQRYALHLEYFGTAFQGWQKQPNQSINSIQTRVEWAISQIAQETINIQCAGRTDAGVHALGQVIHFDSKKTYSAFRWQRGIQHFLPHTIVVRKVSKVPNSFHARYSAISREYQYFSYFDTAPKLFWLDRACFLKKPLDVASMSKSLEYLIGEKDFSAFRASSCQAKHPIRRILSANFLEVKGIYCLKIRANAFLHHMVRNIVGSLFLVGQKRQDPQWIQSLLLSKNRALAGPTAPPCGLYLSKVEYPSGQPYFKTAPGFTLNAHLYPELFTA